ncbi:hypothetical protein ACIWO4_09420 [Avibacterium paragallinarum]|uniref:hypothetical protein n=1 Tax=Avibacterium paragallinarum TaxID=728 RepID=UPI0039857C5D
MSESAYHFQYRELSKFKYNYDDEWFVNNKGYSVEKLYKVILVLESIQLEKIQNALLSMKCKSPDSWTILDGYIFSIKDIASKTNIDEETIEKIIYSFSLRKDLGYPDMKNINDFNMTNAYPILPLGNGKFLLFQYYSLLEALYETPFFWFNQDDDYKNKAMEHRGMFTGRFFLYPVKRCFW